MDDAARVSPGRSKSFTTLIILLVVMVILTLIFSGNVDWMRRLILSAGWFGWVVSIFLYAVLGATPVPSEPVTFLITSMFGPLAATAVAAVGNLLAAMVEFFIGGQVGGASNFEERKAKLPFGLGRLKIDSPMFLIIARMLPGYGPKFVAITAGIYNVPFWRYFWTTAVSTVIGAVVVALGSFGLINIPWVKGLMR